MKFLTTQNLTAPLVLLFTLSSLLLACGSTSEPSAGSTSPESVTTASTAQTGTSTAPTSTVNSTANTTEAPTTTVELPPGLHALVPDHNVLNAKRVNIVFAANDVPAELDWINYSRELLAWDGPVPINRFEGVAVEPEQANGVAFGVFAIEPFLSYRDSFNVWYLDAEAPDRWGWQHTGVPLPVALDDVVEIIIGHELGTPPQALFPAFVPPELPEAGSAQFGPVSLSLAAWNVDLALFDTATVAHELGHAMFGFGDKYLFDSYGADGWLGQSIYPSCAANQDEAEAFFGDLIGVVDPAFDEVYLAAYERYGIELQPPEADQRAGLRIDYVPNGCYGPEGVAIKSTSGGLMHGAGPGVTPVLGAANRRYAEQVLSAWN